MTDETTRQMNDDLGMVERALADLCPTVGDAVSYAILPEAQRYSLLAGGKRIRPILVLAFCRLFGGVAQDALAYACALEMIHTYSLIHDDLPCMDDDDLRRGRPTNHKIYGEAFALLAGDALLTDAFALAAENPCLDGQTNARAVATLSRAAGSHGMAGGQALDLLGEREDHRPDLDTLMLTYRLKTGALLCAAARLGAMAAGVGEGDPRMADAVRYAEGIGLAFQIVDDILDVTADEATLGKTVGSDAAGGKTTTLSFYTVEQARALAADCHRRAVAAIERYPEHTFLTDLADALLCRDH